MIDEPDLTSAIASLDPVEPGSVTDLLARYGAVRTAQAAVAILRDCWREDKSFSAAVWFIRDICRRGIIPESLLAEGDRLAFEAALIETGLIPVFQELLYRPRAYVRRETFHTIGKLCLEAGPQLLKEAFPWYLANDPLQLHHLFLEYRWLKGDLLPLLTKAISNARFSVRWSTLDYLDTQRWDCDQQRKQPYDDLLNRLAHDPHELVRAEAHLVRQCVEAQRLEYEARRKRHRELRQLKKSVLTWDVLEIRFLHERRADDYTIAEFEEFAESLRMKR